MAPTEARSYRPLKEYADDDGEEAVENGRRLPCFGSPWRNRRVQVAVAVPWALAALLGLLVGGLWQGNTQGCRSAQILYSPAQSVVEYKITRFTQGFEDDKSPLQGPPSEIRDRAWQELYGFGILGVSRDEAAVMPNRTGRLAGSTDKYFAELDVFHQLHCLNILRMSRYPEYYRQQNTPEADEILSYFDNEHLEHCIDTIRQSIMCHSDITPLVYQWDEAQKRMRIHGNVVHSCRDFDRIKDWSRERSIVELGLELDMTQNLMDDTL